MKEIPYGYCHCGCGQKTKVSPETSTAKGWIKGIPRKYLNYHNILVGGTHHPHWKGGRRNHGDGYIVIHTGLKSYEYEHRFNAKAKNGGHLPDGSIVHHQNGKDDNENVTIFSSHSDHAIHHANERALKACGNPTWRKCNICHQWDDPANMSRSTNSSRYHKKCAAEKVAKRRKEKGRKRDSRGWLI